jgi:ABC-type nickel/cobalt efflux system permease component RcnA
MAKLLNISFILLMCFTALVGQDVYLEPDCTDAEHQHLENHHKSSHNHGHVVHHHHSDEKEKEGSQKDQNDCKHCHHVCHGHFHAPQIIENEENFKISYSLVKQRETFFFLSLEPHSTISSIYRPPIS